MKEMTAEEIVMALRRMCPQFAKPGQEVIGGAADLIESLAAELAAYRKAEADGRCVVLPCKVGDTVWFIDRRYNRIRHEFETVIQDGYIKAIKFSARPAKITVEYPDINETNGRCKGCDYFISNVGKTVFLTPESANEALKARNVPGGGDN